MKYLILPAALAFGAMTNAAQAATDCDRGCLQDLTLSVLESMKKHDAKQLPLAPRYAMTENGAPVSPVMSSLWRTVTDYQKPGAGQWVIDPQSGQVFVVARVEESTSPSVFFARLRVADRHLTELELFISRSKGESGQLFTPEGLSNLPKVWSDSIASDRLPKRDELALVGRSVFDHSAGHPVGSKHCELVEMGGRVIEDPEALKAIMQLDNSDISHRSAEGGVSVPCTAPDRPEDKNARVIVDVEQGVAVSLGVVPGTVFPSFINLGLESTFVPQAMTAGWERLPKEIHDPNGSPAQKRHGYDKLGYVPMLRSMPSTMAVAEMTRFYDGEVQGVQRYMHMQPVGAGSPWTPASK